MFKVVTPRFSQTFDRWTDALNTAKALIPECKSLTEDIRIFLFADLVWVYSRSHKYPQYIGAGMYDRLARIFVQEAIAESTDSANASAEAKNDSINPGNAQINLTDAQTDVTNTSS